MAGCPSSCHMPSADSILIMKFTLLVRSSLIAELLPIELTLIA